MDVQSTPEEQTNKAATITDNNDATIDEQNDKVEENTQNEPSKETVENQSVESETNESKEDILERKLKELQSLLKHVRKKQGIFPSSFRKRKAEKEIQAKRPKLDISLINDKEKLMHRLKSYSYLYHHKPRPLSALECAQHGWVNSHKIVDKDPFLAILHCIECTSDMYVIDIEPGRYDNTQVGNIEKKYKEGLFNWHKEDCVWRKECSSDDLYSFPLITLSEGVNRFKHEGKMISTYQHIPHVSNELEHATLRKIQYVIRDAEGLSDEDDIKDDITNAYLLALFGWQHISPQIPGVQCSLCFARGQFHIDQQTFDAFNEHRVYCPWRNSQIARALPPKKHYETKTLSGIEWMTQVVHIEYALLVRRHHLGFHNQHIKDEVYKKVKKEIAQSYKLLDETMPRIKQIETIE